jgi:arylsulfatase A-like enzyme
MDLALVVLLASQLLARTAVQAQEPAPKPEAARPSVLFWLIDTCRADHLSLYGHERATTPFLERLGQEGVVFERCYSQAPWTKPSMSSILTSQYPSRHGSTQLLQPLLDSFVTLPEVLGAAGWTTAGFSANPVMGSFTNLDQGFASFRDSWTMIQGESPMDYASGSAAKIVPHAFEWLAKNERRPFFLYMHSLDPHEWYAPAEEFKAKFADPAGEPQFRADWDKLMAAHEDIVNTCTQKTFETAGVEVGPFIDYAERLYDADILANDSAIEPLFERLRAENVLVIVTADHGTEFFEHGATSLGHSLYDEMIHVPLVFWAPGRLPAGLRLREPVRSVDIYPTLLELLGVAVPPDLAGASLVPWIRAGKAAEARTVFADNVEERTTEQFGGSPRSTGTNGESFAVIRWPWKLILHQKARLGLTLPRHELFHLERDPQETKNEAAAQPELVQALEDLILAHVDEGGAAELPLPPEAELDPEARKALEGLGYLGDDEDD